MDVLALKRHLPSIEDGRWVGQKEIKELGDMRVKVRGSSSRIVRETYAAKEREHAADLTGDKRMETGMRIANETLAEVGLVDIEGLTSDGKPVDVAEVRKMILLPEFQPLAELISRAALVVERTRESQLQDIAGN